MPKGHSLIEAEVKMLTERVEALAHFDDRIAALEHRIAQMNDAFSRGNLPSPLGHGSQWTQ